MRCREMMRLMDSGACAKIWEALIYTQRSMRFGKIISMWGAIVDFVRWWANAYFQEWANSGEISFYQLETNRHIFLLKS